MESLISSRRFVDSAFVEKTCVVNRPDRRSTDENMRNFEIMRSILANLIALLHEMNSSHYTNYIDHFKIGEGSGRADLIDFVMEVFVLFKDLIEHPVFPPVSNCKETLRPHCQT